MKETADKEEYFDLGRVTASTPALFYYIPQFSRTQTQRSYCLVCEMLVFDIFLRDNVLYLFEEIRGEGRIQFESQECITCCDFLEFD